MSGEGKIEQRPTAGAVDQAWLRERVTELSEIHRPSASEGEREAAELIAADLRSLGAHVELQREQAHGHYWVPIALLAGAGVLAGLIGRRRRFAGAALGAAAAAALWDDLSAGEHHFRKLLSRKPTWNVVAELGPADAERTVVLVAHHDAARSGLIFHPGIPDFGGRHFPKLIEATDTSPPLMWPVFGGPALAAAGSLSGNDLLRRTGIAISAGTVVVMAEIGSRDVVPGANDNISGVVTLMALARALRERPTTSTRVMLVSTGSEESFMEGMHAFSKRYFPTLDRDRTFILCVDTVGSPHLTVLRGEGMLKMTDYPRAAVGLIDSVAEQLGIHLFPNLRLRNATDGLYALRAGYPSASLCSCTDFKAPANYHWPSDHTGNVDYETMSDAVRLCEGVVRRLDERWL
jgi:hypothetical protein